MQVGMLSLYISFKKKNKQTQNKTQTSVHNMVSGHLAHALNAVNSCLKENNIVFQYDPK